MADASRGPVASLPGAVDRSESALSGSMCDNHDDRKAVIRVQGETDSFGCEYHHLCQECHDAWNAEVDPLETGDCDWCKNPSTGLRPTRDTDEGMAGPVYYVCQPCRKKQSDRDYAEYARLD